MLCAADVRALFVLQDRVSSECDNTYANTDVRSKWGRLEPGKSKYSLQAASLNEAYLMMQDKGLVPVPPGCQVGSVGTENHGQKYFASGYPLPECPSQTTGLVAAYERKPEGKGDDGRCAFFGREPWQITVDKGDGIRCTWPLIKIAHPNLLIGLRDGQSEAHKALAGPDLSIQTSENCCINPAKVGNIIKRKRKKNMTAAKRLQLQNAKLFRISVKKQKRKNKHKGRKGVRKSEEQHTKMHPKKGKSKYLHLQEFLERRRRKRQKCTLDPMAEVMMIMMMMMMMISQKT